MKIGIIDDSLDNNVMLDFSQIHKYKITKCQVKTVCQTNDIVNSTHSTLCCKILNDNLRNPKNHVLIHVDIMNKNQLDINDFIIALEFLFSNQIDVLCLSIGTTILSKQKEIYPLIKKMYDSGITIIAASSNANLITMPAAFQEVIGTIALPVEHFCCQKIYAIPDNDLHVDCGTVLDSNIGNSFSAPRILANLLNKVDALCEESSFSCSRNLINQFLAQGETCNDRQINVLSEALLPKKIINPPIILIESDDISIFSNVLNCLTKIFGYECVCITDNNSSSDDFRIINYNKQNFEQQINISFHRNVDLLLLNSNILLTFPNIVDTTDCCWIHVYRNSMKLTVCNQVIHNYSKHEIESICKDMILLLQE